MCLFSLLSSTFGRRVFRRGGQSSHFLNVTRTMAQDPCVLSLPGMASGDVNHEYSLLSYDGGENVQKLFCMILYDRARMDGAHHYYLYHLFLQIWPVVVDLSLS